MNKFRIGDFVKCIKQSDYEEFRLIVGRKYRVSGIIKSCSTIKLNGHTRSYSNFRFIKINNTRYNKRLKIINNE